MLAVFPRVAQERSLNFKAIDLVVDPSGTRVSKMLSPLIPGFLVYVYKD